MDTSIVAPDRASPPRTRLVVFGLADVFGRATLAEGGHVPTTRPRSGARRISASAAGEGRPPAEIRAAIEVLGATRIGHGTTLLDDGAVVDLVLARGVVIEACPTSNVHVGAIARLEDHPLPRWIDLGERACVCADNTLLSATTAGLVGSSRTARSSRSSPCPRRTPATSSRSRASPARALSR